MSSLNGIQYTCSWNLIETFHAIINIAVWGIERSTLFYEIYETKYHSHKYLFTC